MLRLLTIIAMFLVSITASFAFMPIAEAQEEETAAPAKQEDALSIDQAYAYETAEKQKTGAAFFVVNNISGENDRLIGVSSSIAEKTEIHTMEMAGENAMSMRKVESVEVNANSSVEFTPHGYHIMLVGLHEPLKADTEFTLNLTFEHAGEITLSVPVRGHYMHSQ